MEMANSNVEMPSELLDCHYSYGEEKDVYSPSEFTFETDHEALRNNPDYLALLKTFSILQSQKIQAVKDIDTLLEAREEALRDPLGLVEKLQRGESLQLPGKQKVAEIPDIEWEKYIACHSAKKPETRNKGQYSAVATTLTKDKDSRHQLDGFGCKVEKTSRGQYLVRGRVFDEQKPKTFNQPWTPEEQRRLEELLLTFPSEEVEMERWKKIANALGNRTAIQVQSRTQKYFLKLQKLGLPVPGRHVRMKQKSSTSSGKGLASSKSKSIMGARGSTFFPNLLPTVKMNENADDEDDSNPKTPEASYISSQSEAGTAGGVGMVGILNDLYTFEDEDVSDESDVDEKLRNTPEYEELIWLKRIRREKEIEESMDTPWIHNGFRCDGCNKEPIIGGRFQCKECKGLDTVDFCCDCAPKGLEIGNHVKQHTLRPVRKNARKFLVDRDYLNNTKSSYLDPNFMK